MELSQSEQVRFRRLTNEGPYSGGTYKEDLYEVTIHTEPVSSMLPGQVYSFLRELRPPK